ncbi:MAG: 16S rRNA (uracil(1498)-N(3))-methyltransferase [Butyrivibrio sp.]
MNRFFGKSENISDNTIIIDGSDVNHMKNVLRLKMGEQVIVNGGNNKDYLCSINSYEDGRAVLNILEILETDRELPARVYLFQGLPKGDKMELIIQKCVELGIYEIIPVAMKRCVVRLDDKKAETKLKRYRMISESAAKQSGRGMIPDITQVMTYKEALDYAGNMDVAFVPYELSEGIDSFKKVVAGIKPGMKVGFFIGPEGGFDKDEIDLALSKGIQPVSLGRRILRTETAGLAVMSVLMYHLEV